jgi:inorganic triphosphatase YgiF
VELEIKFNLPAGSISALDSHPTLQSVAQQTRHEVTTYFDTQSRQLSQLGASLRVRRWGKRRMQTLKLRTNQGAFRRNEWEWAVWGDTPELDRLAETPVAPMLHSGIRLLPRVCDGKPRARPGM